MLSKFLVSKSLSQINMSKFYEIGSWGQTHKTFLGCSKIVLIKYGATTLGIMTHSMVTLSIITPIIAILSKMAPGIMVCTSSSISQNDQANRIGPMCVFWEQSLHVLATKS
jgi:hypothetical protein